MTWQLAVLAYLADVAIVVTYFTMATGRGPARWFHFANMVGAPPIIATEIIVGAWQALILTCMFGTVGAVGWLTTAGATR